MRSRYSAYATGDAAYLVRSWHPRTRPDELHLDPAIRWTGLTVVRTERGGAGDDDGVVEFVASWSDESAQSAQSTQSTQSTTSAGGVLTGTLHEVSRFERRTGRWLYVDGDHV